MAEKFSVGLIQMSCSLDPRENFAKAESRIQEAAKRGAQIICLQELFRSQYFCREENADLFELAEAVPGPSTEALSKLARSLNVVIVGSLFERRAPGIYHNTAAIMDADGSLLGKYRKMHIPDDPLYYEKFYFTPGDLGFPNFNTRFGRIGVLVEGSADKEEILVVECDPARVEETRRNWPFLRDRRIDAYSPILERWHE